MLREGHGQVRRGVDRFRCPDPSAGFHAKTPVRLGPRHHECSDRCPGPVRQGREWYRKDQSDLSAGLCASGAKALLDELSAKWKARRLLAAAFAGFGVRSPVAPGCTEVP